MTRPAALARALFVGVSALFALHCGGGGGGDTGNGGASTDNHPGNLVITSPARAAFVPATSGSGAGSIAVTGTGATPALTIDGAPAQVGPDGSFHATVKATPGLNLIEAVDGDSHLETPFVYGRFRKSTDAVEQALGIEIGAAGIGGAVTAPHTTLTALVNEALAGVDLLASVKGETLTGSAPVGGSWKYQVSSGKYAGVTVSLAPRDGGLDASVVAKNVEIDGTLTVSYLGHSTSGPVKMTATSATITGDVQLSVDASGVKAAMPAASAALQGFHYDSGNAGFPCCVDSVMTSVLQPKVESGIKDAVEQKVPAALSGAMSGLKIAGDLDLSPFGITPPITIAAHVDGVDFSEGGGTLTASLLFGSTFPPDRPGAKAPGWLALGAAPASEHRAAIGISVSFDVVNQVFFTMWGSGALARGLPDAAPVTDLTLDPRLPPLLSPTPTGMQIAIGELVFDGKLHDAAFSVAVTLFQDVTARADGDTLSLDPKGEPKLSFTWLTADGLPDATHSLLEAAAKDQITKVLKSVSIPLPTLALDKLGSGFGGQTLALDAPTLAIDPATARVALSGGMTVRAPTK